MAASTPDRLGFPLVLLAVLWCAHAAALMPGARLPISLNADSSDFDRRNERLIFEGVHITQGDLGIRADYADSSALDFNDSLWVFRGHVRITSESASIEADDARLNFVDHRLESAVITGKPARFQHQREDAEQMTRGQAELLEYDFEAGILKLQSGAWITEGANEISGNTLVYHIREQRIIADSDAEGVERVHITISPQPDESPADAPGEGAGAEQ